jgi:GNAT superfamily N-acetyltransferase
VIGVVVRRCRRPDLPLLEWDGEFTPARALFAQLFALARRGAIVMLVAGCAREHLGQIWIDLARTPPGALLWALRVKPTWRGRGVGTQLIMVAEQVAASLARPWAEIEVEPGNLRARALYERLGYRWNRSEIALDALSRAPLDFEVDVLRRQLAAIGHRAQVI